MTTAGTDLTWELPSRGRVGMFCLIAAEAAIFTIFVVAYLFYIGKSLTGPMPRDVLRVPIFYYDLPAFEQSDDSLRRQSASRRAGSAAFRNWWFGTIALGATFLFGTAREWYRLIYRGWTDDQHQSVRHDLLFAGRPARLPRDCRPDPPLHRHGIHAFSGT